MSARMISWELTFEQSSCRDIAVFAGLECWGLTVRAQGYVCIVFQPRITMSCGFTSVVSLQSDRYTRSGGKHSSVDCLKPLIRQVE